MIAVSSLEGGVQGAIPITDNKPAITHDNACTAFLWRQTDML
ncbi:hypothetical protein [Acetobacter syzygii]|nr:hypothetical protein [Acetobacter syzygii]